jgi:hypothetical protein
MLNASTDRPRALRSTDETMLDRLIRFYRPQPGQPAHRALAGTRRTPAQGPESNPQHRPRLPFLP